MFTISASVCIDAPVGKVWRVLPGALDLLTASSLTGSMKLTSARTPATRRDA